MFEAVARTSARKQHVTDFRGAGSIKKSPFEVFSYWHTRVSTMGEFARAGKRFAT